MVEDILRLVHIYDRYYVLLPTLTFFLFETAATPLTASTGNLYQAYELRVRPQICDLLARRWQKELPATWSCQKQKSQTRSK